jgi:hypothetical protein
MKLMVELRMSLPANGNEGRAKRYVYMQMELIVE